MIRNTSHFVKLFSIYDPKTKIVFPMVVLPEQLVQSSSKSFCPRPVRKIRTDEYLVLFQADVGGHHSPYPVLVSFSCLVSVCQTRTRHRCPDFRCPCPPTSGSETKTFVRTTLSEGYSRSNSKSCVKSIFVIFLIRINLIIGSRTQFETRLESLNLDYDRLSQGFYHVVLFHACSNH